MHGVLLGGASAHVCACLARRSGNGVCPWPLPPTPARREGVYDATPAYDKAARRYLITATCGGKGAALLAASATPDPLGPWFLFMLLADAADTGLACTAPKETAVAESARLTYDANGVYISL